MILGPINQHFYDLFSVVNKKDINKLKVLFREHEYIVYIGKAKHNTVRMDVVAIGLSCGPPGIQYLRI